MRDAKSKGYGGTARAFSWLMLSKAKTWVFVIACMGVVGCGSSASDECGGICPCEQADPATLDDHLGVATVGGASSDPQVGLRTSRGLGCDAQSLRHFRLDGLLTGFSVAELAEFTNFETDNVTGGTDDFAWADGELTLAVEQLDNTTLSLTFTAAEPTNSAVVRCEANTGGVTCVANSTQ